METTSILGLYRDNGKENGNYLGFRVSGLAVGGSGRFSKWVHNGDN